MVKTSRLSSVYALWAKWSGKGAAHLALVSVLALFVYSNTFDAPFQFDDKHFFTERNRIIKDLGHFARPSTAKGYMLYDEFRRRYVGYLTFALNYRLGGVGVWGYHAANVLVHVLNGLLVYWLALLTFRTPALARSALAEKSKYVALFSALFFVAHPVQTQAVTYVIQRLAALAAMFYLLALSAYALSRLSEGRGTRLASYALALVAATLAMKTKETAFTLPLTIVLYEYTFFKDRARRHVLFLAPFLLTLLIVPVTLMALGMDHSLADFIRDAAGAARRETEMPRADYLFTQFRVVLTYLRLLVLPVNQNLDYDYPVFTTFFTLPVAASSVVLHSFLLMGLWLLARSRRGDGALKLVAFGVFWFFIALSVESSFIPIADVSFEHRLYLPSVGFFWALTTGAFLAAERPGAGKLRAALVPALCVITTMFVYTAYTRNSVWRSEIKLWEDTVRKSPGKARGHYNLALAYQEKGLAGHAKEHYLEAVRLQPGYWEAHVNLGNIYAEEGDTARAVEHYEESALLRPDPYVLYALAEAYVDAGRDDRAIEYFEVVVSMDPANAGAHNDLGALYGGRGDTAMAIKHFSAAVGLLPENAEARNNLGVAYLSAGLAEEAAGHLSRAVAARPGYAEARFNLAKAYFLLGMLDEAIMQNEAVVELEPDSERAHHNLAVLYYRKGDIAKGKEHALVARQLEGGRPRP